MTRTFNDPECGSILPRYSLNTESAARALLAMQTRQPMTVDHGADSLAANFAHQPDPALDSIAGACGDYVDPALDRQARKLTTDFNPRWKAVAVVAIALGAAGGIALFLRDSLTTPIDRPAPAASQPAATAV